MANASSPPPSGAPSARITARFLKRKLAEYETLKAEIAQLTAEVDHARSESTEGKRA